MIYRTIPFLPPSTLSKILMMSLNAASHLHVSALISPECSIGSPSKCLTPHPKCSIASLYLARLPSSPLTCFPFCSVSSEHIASASEHIAFSLRTYRPPFLSYIFPPLSRLPRTQHTVPPLVQSTTPLAHSIVQRTKFCVYPPLSTSLSFLFCSLLYPKLFPILKRRKASQCL